MKTRQNFEKLTWKNKTFVWLGLTGGIATGKSTASQFFQDLGVVVINADVLAHEALRPGEDPYLETLAHFGEHILLPNKEIDRKALASLVFADEKHKLKLESIVHPYVQSRGKQLQTDYVKQGHVIMLYDVPLLFEKNLQDQFDATIVVTSSETLQIQRMRQRNQWSDEEILRRLQNQIPLKEKVMQADFVIQNEGTLEELKQNVMQVYTEIKRRAGVSTS